MKKESKDKQDGLAEGPCLRCGFSTDKKLGDNFVCDDCYFVRGSCCPEFGPDDISAACCDNSMTGKQDKKP